MIESVAIFQTENNSFQRLQTSAENIICGVPQI